MILVKGYECYCSRGLAKLLGIGRNTMLKELRKRGVLNYKNLPTTAYKGYGYFIVSEANAYSGFITYYRKEAISAINDILKDYIIEENKKMNKKEKPYKEESRIDLDDVLKSV